MVVNLLLKILKDYELCTGHGIQVQFVTHKRGSFWADEIYEDAILVTPYDEDGNLNKWGARYYFDVKFSDWRKRASFYELMSLHNKRNNAKDDFIPIHHFCVGNECSII